jgi:hypothetical protein
VQPQPPLKRLLINALEPSSQLSQAMFRGPNRHYGLSHQLSSLSEEITPPICRLELVLDGMAK